VNARARLAQAFAPAVVDAIAELADERAAARLEIAQPEGEREWYTTEEAAERLGVTPAAVRKQAYRGRHETRHVGARLYVSAATVDAR
jgi:DNA-directed RNA polymerase specialized sigma24 family protein